MMQLEGQTAPMDGKPNIVLILMDNLGYGELGAYGGGILRGAPTPRLDKLAMEGTRLLNFNVEAQCTPSRAALMTGRHGIRSGNGSVPIDMLAMPPPFLASGTLDIRRADSRPTRVSMNGTAYPI